MPRRYGSRRRYGGRRRSYGRSRRPTVGATFFRATSRRRTAGWRWLLTGVLVGTVSTGMLYINEHPMDDWQPLAAKERSSEDAVLAEAKPKHQYEFYQLLSKPTHPPDEPLSSSSVPPVPKVPAKALVSAAVAAPSALPQATATAPAKTAVSAEVTKGSCHLQLASLPKQADAKRLQSKLHAKGIATNIEIAQVKGRVWYRVQSLQLASEAHANALKRSLETFGINARVVHHN